MIFRDYAQEYIRSITESFTSEAYKAIETLTEDLLKAWKNNKSVYICGNGGSAANAIHIANDLIYGVGRSKDSKNIPGLKVEALSSNSAIILASPTIQDMKIYFQNNLRQKPVKGIY